MTVIPPFRVFEILDISIEYTGVDWTDKTSALGTHPTPPTSGDYDDAEALMVLRVEYWQRLGFSEEMGNALGALDDIILTPTLNYADAGMNASEGQQVADLGYADIYDVGYISSVQDPDFNAFIQLGITGWSDNDYENAWDLLYPPSGGTSEPVLDNTVQTTDATATQIATVIVAEEQVIYIDARIVGIRDDTNEACGGRIQGTYYRDLGGNVTLVGLVSKIFEVSVLLTTLDIDIGLTATNVNVNVTGIAAQTWNWRCLYTVMSSL